ncbi:inner centromere protein-like isoform X2 [Dreissena polymorpha]|uniref:inner centromere protein-like isoform X2 n=1 Tax=Dreissena polymorpha TaxID=45954 RepID=UPI00226519C3|nr:inner centromere protein-like isoform X2 [Dreissena polymorpha]
MTSQEKIKRLTEGLQESQEQTRGVLQGLQKLEAAKKDKENKAALEALEGQLQEALHNMKKLEKEIQETQSDISLKLGRKSAPPERRKPLDPDEQEMAYEIKSQLMKNIEIQNQKLKTEFTLHEKMTESRMLSQQNKRLHEDVTMSRANSMRLIKMFERKAKEADTKLKEMAQEVTRSQDLAEKYRNLYELERRKNLKEGDQLPPIDVQDNLPNKESTYTFLGGNTRVNDVIRKNEVLTEENYDLRREIKRLKEDNQRFLKQTKTAMADRDQMLHKLETSEQNRRDLLKRLEKEKGQHQLLSKSLTRQASDWILLKKQIAQFDEEYRWSQVGRVDPQTADERSRVHHVTKNVYMPRKMYPVEEYDKTATQA